MIPVGDKVVLKEVEGETKSAGGIVMPGGDLTVRAIVLAVGKGMPYGRGEFYEPVLKQGQHVAVARQVFEGAPMVRVNGDRLRVLHEREVLLAYEGQE